MSYRNQDRAENERRHPARPIVAVGAVVLNDTGQVLLIKRAKPPRAGEWSLPGGAIELGETIEAALIREVREETGLDIKVQRALMNVNSIIKDTDGKTEYHYVLLDYLAKVSGGTLMAGDDALDAGFFDIETACSMVKWGETKDLLKSALGHQDAML